MKPTIKIGNHTFARSDQIYVTGIGSLEIGKHCAIGLNFHVATSDHLTNTANMNDVTQKMIGGRSILHVKGPVKIGNACWIGHNVTIVSGVTIGDGVVIGAGSVVCKNLDDFGIYAGNPARFIRYRFCQRVREDLKELKWWDWSLEEMIENKAFFDLDLSAVYNLGRWI